MDLVFDLFFAYDDDDMRTYRPYVRNCPLDRLSYYTQRVANLCCVCYITVSIHSSSLDAEFEEFTI